ncbi:MAG: hypothetical protein OMM_02263 [Candidatus Magnetoglobus multicellularis str. Araruama]|uniref:Endonuclease/exonuclease/phosphatase domain-containing protein n=1 Tax=Candidatus Magnetoglobus multicellularis str. Araruama TaxID=890399 RepID=A0A1V1PA93_9BACT|nr:MAG: hypothetical protein OMM_02263 [Candidatus Magnetoglobus multicellularis str. Araruama]
MIMSFNNEITVISINAGGGVRGRNTKVNPIKTAISLGAIIKKIEINSTVIAMQESLKIWNTSTSAYVETGKELAINLDLSYTSIFAPYLDSDFHTHQTKWEQESFKGYKKVQQGNSIITNINFGNWPWKQPCTGYPGHDKKSYISTQISNASIYSTGNRDTEPRNIVVVPLQITSNITAFFIATHLTKLTGENRNNLEDSRSKEASEIRLGQINQIFKIVKEIQCMDNYPLKSPIILAGDFNAMPGSIEILKIEEIFQRVPLKKSESHAASEEFNNVDHIFLNDPNNILSTNYSIKVDPHKINGITDHLPVVAKFEINEYIVERANQSFHRTATPSASLQG